MSCQQLAIRMSQATAVEPSSTKATESDRGEGRKKSEENTKQRSEKSDEEERLTAKIEKKVEKEMKNEIEVKEQVEVAVEVEEEMQLEVKMVPPKKKRNEVQVWEMIKKMKAKREKILKKK
ncbi:hypothetical protein Syun_001553 [Stephania yunnanensis]|uniref:Uncharacterized protein n=1 Tax=Stephania yunnanensis TaxID=152371 RepID=A0AAP0LF17_9MAGN